MIAIRLRGPDSGWAPAMVAPTAKPAPVAPRNALRVNMSPPIRATMPAAPCVVDEELFNIGGSTRPGAGPGPLRTPWCNDERNLPRVWRDGPRRRLMPRPFPRPALAGGGDPRRGRGDPALLRRRGVWPPAPGQHELHGRGPRRPACDPGGGAGRPTDRRDPPPDPPPSGG